MPQPLRDLPHIERLPAHYHPGPPINRPWFTERAVRALAVAGVAVLLSLLLTGCGGGGCDDDEEDALRAVPTNPCATRPEACA